MAFMRDMVSGVNTDGSARYTDPDDQPQSPLIFMKGGNQEQSNFLPNNDASANFDSGSAVGNDSYPRPYRSR